MESWPPNDQPQGSSVNLLLDKLTLDDVSVTSSTAAASFGNFLAHLSVPFMELGNLMADDYKDSECGKIVSEFKIPSVEKLTLAVCSGLDHPKAALKAARATITDLTVLTYCGDEKDIPSRRQLLKYLTRLIRKAAKLKSLTVREHCHVRLRLSSRMIEAIEGCATITQFRLIHETRSDERQDPDIRRALARNNELARFVASPSTYPTQSLPSLILQFDNCPSGRFMLARCLPEVLSFEHLVF